MKIVCTQENLARGVSVVSRSVGKDSNLPVLSNILIEAKDGEIKFQATNLEIGAICNVRGKIEEKGSATVPAQLLQNYISNLPNTNVELISKGQLLNIKCGNYSGEIKGIDPTEFPLIPKIDSASICSVRGLLFHDALTKIVFAAARDEMRPEISGVFISVSGNKMRLAATDSYRLGEVVIDLSEVAKKEFGIIVPVSTMQELMRMLDKNDNMVFCTLMEGQIKFTMGDITLVSRLIEGQYPDYLKIIPKEFTTELELSRAELLKAIKTTSLFAKNDTKEMHVRATGAQKTFEISAESGQVGKNISKLTCGFSGKDAEAIFNSRYFAEGLNSISSDIVRIKLLGNTGPGMLLDKEEKSHFYIVMPIKK